MAPEDPGPETRLPLWKLLLFSAVTTVGLLALLEGGLALAGVEPAYVRADPLAGFAARIPHFHRVEEDGAPVIAVLPSKRDEMNRQRFAPRKPEGVTRIFCLGGSTTYGHPFFDATSFCGWLRAYLPVADPSARWEVVNAGAISYASYRISGILLELLAYEPDLFVVYTGQNEFLERRTYEALLEAPEWQTGAAALVSHTRTATVLRRVLGLDPGAPEAAAGGFGLTEEVDVVQPDTVGPEEFTRGDPPPDAVVGYFEEALGRMVDTARDDAEILFVVPASNLADFAPFRSQPRDGLTPAETARFAQLREKGRARARAGAPADAVAHFDEALVIDERYAALHFDRGRALRALGRDEEARAAFERAIEEDVVPFRAPAAVRAAMRDVAGARDVPLVDFEALVARHSRGGIADEELFFDHVHPTIEAHRLLALAIVEELAARGTLHPNPDWGDDAIAAVDDRVLGAVDRARHAAQLRKLAALLDRVGQPEQARKQALEAVGLSGGDPEAWYQAGVVFHKHGLAEEAVEQLRHAAEGLPESEWVHTQLGLALADTGRADEAVAALTRATEIAPEFARARASLGVLLLQQGRNEAAATQLAEAVRLGPRDVDAKVNLGIAYARARRSEEAATVLGAALRLRPGDTRALYAYAVALERTGRRDEAIRFYRTVLKQSPQHAQAKRRLTALTRAPR